MFKPKTLPALLVAAIIMLVVMAEYGLFVDGIYDPFQLGAGIAVIALAWTINTHAARFIKANYEY
jgi:hypothetical protein